MAKPRPQPAAITSLHARQCDSKGAPRRRCVETRDPERVALAYAIDSRWRNRSEFITGRSEIIAFLSRKWARARLQTYQGDVGVYWKSDRRTLRLRVA